MWSRSFEDTLQLVHLPTLVRPPRPDDLAATAQARSVREVWPIARDGNLSLTPTKEEDVPLAIAGTGYGVIGVLVIILLVVLIIYFVRRA